MSDTRELSVILPCHNAAATIREQLEALERQEWPGGWELIVVDNRSADESMDIVRGFSDRIPDLRIVEANERQGQPYAMNVGIGAASGISVVFIDADDVVGDGWLRALGTALQQAEFVASAHDARKLNPDWLIGIRGERQTRELQKIWYPPYLTHAGGCGLAARRTLLQQAGGFDEALPCLHDTDLCFRLQRGGASLKLVRGAVIHVRHKDRARAMFHQARRWARFNQLLYSRYRNTGAGPTRAWGPYVSRWYWLFRRAHLAKTRRGRHMLAWHTGWQIGLLQGSLKHRIRPAPYSAAPVTRAPAQPAVQAPAQPAVQAPAQPGVSPRESSRA